MRRLLPDRPYAAASAVADAFGTLIRVNGGGTPDDEALAAASDVLCKGLNTLLSSVGLAVRGFVTEPPILGRHSLECASVGWHLRRDTNIIPAAPLSRHRSPDSVTAASEALPKVRALDVSCFGSLTLGWRPGCRRS